MALKDNITWFKANFGPQIVAATAGTPFDVDMLTAIAVQETGSIWGRLIGKGLTNERILELCVGDVINAPKRSAFPKDREALVAWPRGDEMHTIARAGLADMAAYITEYKPYVPNPERFCHGYGLFQYDLQFFKIDPDYFLEKRYTQFDQTLGKAISELTEKLAHLGPQLGWAPNRKLSDADKAALAIAYNTGGYNPAKGLKQGFKDPQSGKYYGEYFAEYMALAKTVPLPAAPTPTPTPTPTPSPAPAPAPSPAPAGEAMLVSVTDFLNVRSTPAKLANNVVAKLPNDMAVTAYESQNGYRRIDAMLVAKPVGGWVAADFLKPAGEAMIVDVASAPLNLRSAPAQASGNIIAQLPKGLKVTAFDTQNAFRHVKAVVGGQPVEGWAAAQYLKKG